MITSLLYPFRLALAALTWPSRRCEDLTAQALADAQQCPDFIEPPEPEPDAQEPIYPRDCAFGAVATIGHPANGILIIRDELSWCYVDGGDVVPAEQFRAGWDLV